MKNIGQFVAPAINVFAALVTTVNLFINYKLTKRQSEKQRELQFLRERYDNFYIPYLSKVLYHWYIFADPSSLPKDLQDQLITLVLNNLKYTGTNVQSCIPDVLEGYSIMEYERNSFRRCSPNSSFGKAILNLNQAVATEADHIAQKLNIQSISKALEKTSNLIFPQHQKPKSRN